jgi:hypothetical protein
MMVGGDNVGGRLRRAPWAGTSSSGATTQSPAPPRARPPLRRRRQPRGSASSPSTSSAGSPCWYAHLQTFFTTIQQLSSLDCYRPHASITLAFGAALSLSPIYRPAAPSDHPPWLFAMMPGRRVPPCMIQLTATPNPLFLCLCLKASLGDRAHKTYTPSLVT